MRGSTQHPGCDTVRTLLDSFEVDVPDGIHHCLVHLPLGESHAGVSTSKSSCTIAGTYLSVYTQACFRGAWIICIGSVKSYIQVCGMLPLSSRFSSYYVYTLDIKGDNIMLSIQDDSVFSDLRRGGARGSMAKEGVGRKNYLYLSDTSAQGLWLSGTF